MFKMKSIISILFVFTLMSCGDNEENQTSETNPDFNEETTVVGNTGESSDSNSTGVQATNSHSEETFTITNKTYLLVTVASGSFSQNLDKGECVILTRSQFTALKVQRRDGIDIIRGGGKFICDNTHRDTKCPTPNNYDVKQRWSIKMLPADKKAENCKTLL